MTKPVMREFKCVYQPNDAWYIKSPELVAGCWQHGVFIIYSAGNPLATDVYIDVAIEYTGTMESMNGGTGLFRYFVNPEGWLPVFRHSLNHQFHVAPTNTPVSVEQYKQTLELFANNGQPLLPLGNKYA